MYPFCLQEVNQPAQFSQEEGCLKRVNCSRFLWCILTLLMVHPCPYPYGASEPVEKDGHLACFAEHIQVTDKAISENMRLLGCVCKTCKNCDNCCYDSTKLVAHTKYSWKGKKGTTRPPRGTYSLGLQTSSNPATVQQVRRGQISSEQEWRMLSGLQRRGRHR